MAEEKKKMSFWKKAIIGGAVTLVVLIIIAIASGDETKTAVKQIADQATTQQAAVQPIEQKKEVIKLTASELGAEYKENAVATEAKYKDKTIEITGVTENIDKDILDKPYITFASSGYVWNIQAYFPKEREASMLNLKRGQQITLQCTYGGSSIGLTLENCSIIN